MEMEAVMVRVGRRARPLRSCALFLAAVVLLPGAALGEQTASEVLKRQLDRRLWEEVGQCDGAERYLEALPEGLNAEDARKCLAAGEVERLLEECEAHLAAGRLSTGRGGNAADCYGEVLSKDRGNKDALSGLDRVMGEYGRRVRKALEGERLERARGYLEEMGKLGPESREVEELEDAIAEAKRRKQEAEEEARRKRAQGPGMTLQDCPECPEMVVVPSGRFQMGSPSSDKGRLDDEGPVHEVTIARPFAVGVNEVTRGEFARFVSATGRSMGNACWTYESGEWKARSGRHWRDPGFSQTDEHPVVCVRWNDAQAYVRWLSGETGEAYRLPSEAEWEYVARAGTRTAWYWGESESGQCRYANGADEASGDLGGGKVRCNDGHARTSPVGSYEANGYGLHDVLGNVWEWVQDCWNGSYAGAPRDGSAWTSGECGRRVLRGGSWHVNPRNLRSADRGRYWSGNRVSLIGFRVARTLTP